MLSRFGGADATTAVHVGATSVAPGEAFLLENAALARPDALLVATTDDVPGTIASNRVLAVGATPVVSTIDTIGDLDFFKVTLSAGHSYEFAMSSKAGGPGGVPLADSYLELYDAQGHLIGSADGGASTTINTVNSGFDAILSFTPTTSGTYYVNARAFDNVAQDGTNGDMVGDYTLAATDVSDVPHYVPYYDASSPLYAIDWGTQVDGTVRNPDGNETGHLSGNAQGTPDNPAGYDVAGKNVVTIYFAKAGDVFTPGDPTNPGLPPVLVSTGTKDWEKGVVFTALAEFSKVADVTYVEVQDRDEANFLFTTYQGTPGPVVSLLGSMSPPQESDEGLAQFNSGDYRWTEENLAQGGFSYVTLIHEFGHGHGLAHPHDNGGHSGVMNGVESDGVVADYTTGDYELNQGVFTMMSYEDGWQSSPYGNAETDAGYGYLGGLMAFDIAAIQDKYGVNEDWAKGNDTYTLKDVNAVGTYFSSIWDTGGTDQIVYQGARDTTIDLRAATLAYEVGGGGRVSFADGIFGGYTIANGVVIENASSGSGADHLYGNVAANQLSSGAGHDVLDGGAGADRMTGGTGNDAYYVDNAGDVVVEAANGGSDRVFSSLSYTLGANLEKLTLIGTGDTTGRGNSYNNDIKGNGGHNVLDGGTGADTMSGGKGNDAYYVDNVGDVVNELANEGSDRVFSSISYTIHANLEKLTLTGTANIDGRGNSYNNDLKGNAGNNVLNGGTGSDTLTGGAGADHFLFDTKLGSSNVDRILDFSVKDDTIDLDRSLFTKVGAAGALAAGAFFQGANAHDATDRIVYDQASGHLFYDADGNGSGAAVLFATVTAGTALTAADFLVVP